jgi:hypothetical protein
MSFGHYNIRTPYEVQRDNGGRYTFDKIKERYENTKPIQGKKRKHLDIRPNGERGRSHERIVKVNDNEYYLTFDAWRWSEIHQPDRQHTKAISFHLVGDMETVVVHTPRTNWKEEKNLYPRAFSSPSVFYFYDFNLPIGLNMVNYKSAKYVRLDTEQGYLYYTVEKGDTTFTRRVGEKYWKPMVVHREVIHLLDREKTKEWRNTAKPLLDYLNVMVDMVEPQYIGWWQNVLAEATQDIAKDKVFKQDDGEAPEHWFKMAEYYKKRIEAHDWCGSYRIEDRKTIYRKDKLKHYLYKDLYKLVKPLKAVEVPLGEPCKDRFKSWF